MSKASLTPYAQYLKLIHIRFIKKNRFVINYFNLEKPIVNIDGIELLF